MSDKEMQKIYEPGQIYDYPGEHTPFKFEVLSVDIQPETQKRVHYKYLSGGYAGETGSFAIESTVDRCSALISETPAEVKAVDEGESEKCKKSESYCRMMGYSVTGSQYSAFITGHNSGYTAAQQSERSKVVSEIESKISALKAKEEKTVLSDVKLEYRFAIRQLTDLLTSFKNKQ